MRKWSGLGLGLLLLALAGCGAPPLERDEWKVIPTGLSDKADLLDIAFVDDENGWAVGSRSTLLRTADGGESWSAIPVKLDSDSRFLSVSFDGKNGWIGGEPKRLLRTVNGGESWTSITLDRRLPGSPIKVYALGPDTAEVVLNSGLVIKTVNGGKNWQVVTPASAGGIRSAERVADGSYWVVSTRGGSYLQWKPGDPQWTNYERTSSRRIQAMGFSGGKAGWMINQGGEMQFTANHGETWTPGRSVILNGLGLLDADYTADDKKIWAAGGGGTLIVSADDGQNWKAEEVPGIKGSLLNVEFIGNKGFVLGQNGVLLKYRGAAD
ncbi:photosynthesis system II assembly factor Ycf48 [Gloeobacter morelensis]|uniref:Photosystem II assembly lipoprotein Ycf48 n=1 Tax=Gloeobacter morelensis MG652769 TaxID=2781736 RepID=A0ABY3PSZ7_9CYAN|nr:photosynthesis system II assembly factor Ycf48 [Gloeobacter morelensis]UFP96618.1 photosynthesis system II assembly factor Ycf48 [Gloeobacter morelensis MG652769]